MDARVKTYEEKMQKAYDFLFWQIIRQSVQDVLILTFWIS